MWQADLLALRLTTVGFKRLLSSPVAFYHPERDLVGVVHGDDFVFVGADKELDFVMIVLKEHYELKDRGRLGSGENDRKEVDLLCRKVRWHEWCLTWEGDERHRKMVINFFGMDENSEEVDKNGFKEDDVKDATDSEELDIQECTSYRMLAARLNFTAQDNPAIQYSAKEICRNMTRPETAHYAKIKKLARFFLGVKTVKWECPWQEEQEAVRVQVFSDSDWVATSSVKAEVYSAAEGVSRGLGLQSMLPEMVDRLSVRQGVRTCQTARTYAPSGRERLVGPGFGERRPSHIEEDPWQSQRVRRAHEVLRQILLHKVAQPCWNPHRSSRESRLDRGGLLIHLE